MINTNLELKKSSFRVSEFLPYTYIVLEKSTKAGKTNKSFFSTKVYKLYVSTMQTEFSHWEQRRQ